MKKRNGGGGGRGGHTTIQQYVGVQFQINPLLFETNYIRQFANIEVITLAILTSGLKRVCFLLFICFFLFILEVRSQVD